jgi:hypothetical protein
MTTKVEEFVRLHAAGLSTAEIASKLNARYQHVYNELRRYHRIVPNREQGRRVPHASTPPLRPLSGAVLRKAGFSLAGRFAPAGTDGLRFDRTLPKERGVYAFCVDDRAHYVGVASSGVASRLNFYLRPGATQKTSIRVKGLVAALLGSGVEVEVLVAFPGDHLWNGLPVDGCAGLESALIAAYDLPWNLRGKNRPAILPE